jgi:hypothetical protein
MPQIASALGEPVAEPIRLGTDKPVEVGQFERPPQVGVRVQFKWVKVEPKGSR